MRSERDSLICLGKDCLGAVDKGKRKTLAWVCSQGVPGIIDGANSLWSLLKSKTPLTLPECAPHYCGLGT